MSENQVAQGNQIQNENDLNNAILDYLRQRNNPETENAARNRFLAMLRNVLARGSQNNARNNTNNFETLPVPNYGDPKEPEEVPTSENQNKVQNPSSVGKNNNAKGGRRRSRKQKKTKRGKNTRRK